MNTCEGCPYIAECEAVKKDAQALNKKILEDRKEAAGIATRATAITESVLSSADNPQDIKPDALAIATKAFGIALRANDVHQRLLNPGQAVSARLGNIAEEWTDTITTMQENCPTGKPAVIRWFGFGKPIGLQCMSKLAPTKVYPLPKP